MSMLSRSLAAPQGARHPSEHQTLQIRDRNQQMKTHQDTCGCLFRLELAPHGALVFRVVEDDAGTAIAGESPRVREGPLFFLIGDRGREEGDAMLARFAATATLNEAIFQTEQ
jgi:hypothetical protein